MESHTELIKEVLDNMSLGENLEDTLEASKWIDSHETIDKSNDIDTILKNIKVSSNKVKKQNLIKFADQVKSKSNFIAQIEIVSRGILFKDTKKSVDIFVKYLRYYTTFVKNSDKSKGVYIAVFDDTAPLWLLAFALAPALASGYTVLFQVSLSFAAVVNYILTLAVNAGIPEDSIVLLPSKELELQLYLSCEQVSIVALFIDLLDPNIMGVNKFHKKILIFSSYKTPMIIFDDADLESAVHNIIEAAWGYEGLLPWAAGTILIQENIFSIVTNKLKEKLTNLKIGYGCDKNADIAFPTHPTVLRSHKSHVQKAKELGIEVFEKTINSCYNIYSPTLIIGSQVSTNNVIKSPENTGCVTLVAFRSIDEGINLANNSIQGLGASVWSENIGLINEVSRKLKVNNVWINSHGLFSPEVPITPFKSSGTGWFGSPWGFADHNDTGVPLQQTVLEIPDTYKTVDSIKKAIKTGKSAANSWGRKTLLEKTIAFQQMQDYLEQNKSKYGKKVSEEWINTFINEIDEGVTNVPQFGTFCLDNFNVYSIKESKGVIILELRSKSFFQHSWKVVIAALLEGNAVIILNDLEDAENFYQDLSKQLPAGCLLILPYSWDAAKTCSLHKELGGYFSNEASTIFGSIALSESKIFTKIDITDSWADTFRRVILIKNVWSNIGQSFQCNF